MADALLLSGQRALPVRATDLGFSFRYSNIDEALASFWPINTVLLITPCYLFPKEKISMTRQFSIPALVLAVALAAAAPAQAEVKKEERNQVSFAGALGKIFNFFGGKSAREGVVATVAVSGDRKITTSGENTAK